MSAASISASDVGIHFLFDHERRVVTPTLAHGKFTTVVITVRGSSANGCLQEEDDVLADFGTNGQTAAALITHVAG